MGKCDHDHMRGLLNNALIQLQPGEPINAVPIRTIVEVCQYILRELEMMKGCTVHEDCLANRRLAVACMHEQDKAAMESEAERLYQRALHEARCQQNVAVALVGNSIYGKVPTRVGGGASGGGLILPWNGDMPDGQLAGVGGVGGVALPIMIDTEWPSQPEQWLRPLSDLPHEDEPK